MAAKQILIANADLRMLGEHGRALGQDCKVTLATSSAEAFAALDASECDVIVADDALPEGGGAALLDQIQSKHPKVIRILLVAAPDTEAKIADVQGAHLLLQKPCDNAALKNAIERALAINQWLASNSLRELVGRLRTFPIVPSLYLEVVSALKSPDATTVEIGGIIAKDMAMMTKLLQVTNSASFGLPRRISDPVEAVGILGFETVKTMVMTLKLMSQYDKVKPVYFSIDRLWRHSTEVARIARGIVRAQSTDAALAEAAFAAGLMHDVGKLILAANFDDQYSRAQEMARKRQIPLVEVETEIFGASHGEIGAYLLGLWGMPLDLVETAALHHYPSRSLSKRLGPLTAVHVANALSYEGSPDKQGFVPSTVDQAWLAELGLTGRLDFWRETVLPQETGATEFRSKSSQTSQLQRISNSSQTSQTAQFRRAPTAPASPAVPFSGLGGWKRWLCGGLAAAAFLLLVGAGVQIWVNRALTPPPSPQQETARIAHLPVAAVPVAAVPVADAKSSPAAPALIAAQPEEKPVPAPVVSAPTNDAPTAAPAPVLSPTDLAFNELKLQSIFFSTTHPRAVINGLAVKTNDRLPAGAVVVAINPSSVVLQFENERRTLAMK